jgi:hypothetical protein
MDKLQYLGSLMPHGLADLDLALAEIRFADRGFGHHYDHGATNVTAFVLQSSLPSDPLRLGAKVNQAPPVKIELWISLGPWARRSRTGSI